MSRVLLSDSCQLARKFHPDTNPDKNARDKFVEIQDAYDVRMLSSSNRIIFHLSSLDAERR